MPISVIFATLLSFLPTWFAVFVAVSVSVLMVIATFRFVAFVMDVLPFI